MEGKGIVRFQNGRLHMENELDAEQYGDDAHFVTGALRHSLMELL